MSPSDIDRLVADLKPVRRLAAPVGYLMIAGGLAVCLVATAFGFGLRPDVMALRPAEIVLLRSGALLLVGLAAAAAVIAGARPGVGSRLIGWRWALAAAALVPLTSLTLTLNGQAFPTWVLSSPSAIFCVGVSLASALVIAAPLVFWMRRGAVTELGRAGWLTGLAAGALGTFVYNLACPSTTIHYAAVWYSLTVATASGVGRLAIPPLLRW